VLPVYIIEPDYWRLPDMSGRHWGFIVECLSDLQTDLTRLGAPLVLRVGDAVETLEALRQKVGFTRMISHIETGNLWSFARDQRVTNWARAHSVFWTELPQCAVTRGIARANRWADRRGRFVAEVVSPSPPVLRGV
jgi:deoxyribodipyrimidine photo-lyase